MSRRSKKRARAERAAAASDVTEATEATEETEEAETTEEVEATGAPGESEVDAQEPTGFDAADDATPVITRVVGPLASVEEVDAAIEAVLGDDALGDDEEVLELSMEAPSAEDGPAERWEEPTRVAEAQQLAELAAQSAEPAGTDVVEGPDGEPLPLDSLARLENIVESLLFAADRPLGLADLKRLLNDRDGKKLSMALDALQARRRGTGVELANTAGGWQLRTNPENAVWVAKLVAGRPARLSRAMLETLAIVAYRQPITRPEIDEIRGVDCGPVLKTLLDRTLIRMIGKKEEVGRPILYGTTPEFLRTFSLKDLTELPTLRQFHELGAAEQAKVDAESPTAGGAAAASAASPPPAMPGPTPLPDHDPAEEDALLAELDEASAAASRAALASEPEPPPAPTAEDVAPTHVDEAAPAADSTRPPTSE